MGFDCVLSICVGATLFILCLTSVSAPPAPPPENYFYNLQMFLLIIATEFSFKIPFSDIALREKGKKGTIVDKA